MERFDVDYALISSLKAAYYSGPESEAEVLAVCRKHPKLLPVAGIDLRNNFSRGNGFPVEIPPGL